jgi:anti-sigma factor RsiW
VNVEGRSACDEIRDDLSELALGTLAGRERSLVLDHVATCDPCRAELASLAVVSDALVHLSPLSQPPIGFEVRLLERLEPQSPRELIGRSRSRARRRGFAALCAAAILIIVGFALGNAMTRKAPSSSSPLSATLTSHGRALGHVWLSAGAPSWIYMTLDDANVSGEAWCDVTLKSGRVLDVGVFTLKDGYGAWAARVTAGASSVASAKVTDANGRVLASATLSA